MIQQNFGELGKQRTRMPVALTAGVKPGDSTLLLCQCGAWNLYDLSTDAAIPCCNKECGRDILPRSSDE